MALSPEEIVNGLLSVIIVTIFIYVGIRIALRYIKTKESIYLYVGFTWALMVVAWYPNAISFFPVLILGGDGIPDVLFFTMGTALYPLAVILWLKAFTDLFYKEKQKIVLYLAALGAIIFEIVFFTILAVAPTMIGEKRGPIDAEYEIFMTLFQITLIIIILVTGLKFGIETKKSEDPERKLKGNLLIYSLLIFIVGALLDAVGGFLLILAEALYIPLLIFARTILIVSSIGFYGAYLLPDWMKKLFLK